ncbi:hypothetical protein SAMN04488109_2776 [Chryseolinea serpens]|jgi:hypothetical protein|uniref:Outer membrane protein beta-barrel domain-containing protein n=1 Tax=Chryseolinea serpens TaxID=947013 RepID=A0A1M5PB44_9BACT|nr:hypothetical protein [Chryseolinea serpens]SHG98907.1 hypothetical protein SAMN04488109_2776 [Chryseolinea serpens]
MRRREKFSLLTFFLVLIVAGTYGQTQDSYEYGSEFTWGINKNTSGGLIGGLVFKKARKLNDRVLETFGLELMNVKHPQERRTNSIQTGNLFIYGKSNYLYAIRLQYGRDIILFKKAPHQGVEIKGVFAIGPTIGVVAPYYVEYFPEGGGSYTVRAPYNPNINIDYIAGTGRLFEGLSESKIKPGINFKAAMNFELGTIKSQVTGFEAGFLIDAYSSTIEMMPSTKNYAVYPTLFLTLFYGSRK